MNFIESLISSLADAGPEPEFYVFLVACVLLLAYSVFRSERWRNILRFSLDYHRFHLEAIMNDSSSGMKTREYAQAMLWSINKQLPLDLEKGKGGQVLWRSFLGDKTCINTCGTIFYESARFAPYTDRVIIKLNDTLLSSYYRICLLESLFRPVALLYMDLSLLLSYVFRPKEGTGRLYREMAGELKDSRSEA